MHLACFQTVRGVQVWYSSLPDCCKPFSSDGLCLKTAQPPAVRACHGNVSPVADAVCARCCFIVQDEAASLKSKLEDSRKQLQGNEQMIRWLNNQVCPAPDAALSGA